MSGFLSFSLPSPWDYIMLMTIITVIITVLIIWFCRWVFKGDNWESKASARGRTIIVTGANSGIGRALAEEFSMRGADHVVLACRNPERANKARDEMIANGADASRISMELIDLMSFKSVIAFVNNIKKKFPTIDVLVCNAGCMQGDGPTEDGNEKILQANYLGHFLLVEKLKSLIQLKRVVFVSSLVHKYASFFSRNCEDLTAELDNKMLYMKRYSRAKLAEVAYARYLADQGMEVYSSNPGVVHTNILAGTPLEIFDTLLAPVMSMTMKSPLEGGQTPLMLALAPSNSLKPGAYYSNCKVDNTHSLLANPAKIDRMYQQSVQLCGQFH